MRSVSGSGATKVVAGKNQQVVGSSPSAGSNIVACECVVYGGDVLSKRGTRQDESLFESMIFGDFSPAWAIDRCLNLSENFMLLPTFVGGVPERSKGADCKSAGSAFGGSNPPPSTMRRDRC